jgi:arylsulfatase
VTRLVVRLLDQAVTAVGVGVVLSLILAARSIWEQQYLAQQLRHLALHTLAREMNARALPIAAALLGVLLAIDGARRVWHRRRQLPMPSQARAPWRQRSAFGALVVFGGINLAAVAPRGSADRFNVVLIVIDSLRADHVGTYGYPRRTTPNLDALAAEATVFRRSYSAASWTRPATASLLTAMAPLEHGITSESAEHRLTPAALTLAEYLRNAGYRAGAIITNPHYRYGIDQGFDEAMYYGNFPADYVYDRAIEWVASARHAPFFLLIHNNDPHDSYDYHHGFSTTPKDSRYRRLDGLLPVRVDGSPVPFDSPENRAATVLLDAAALDEMKRNYDGEIAFVDHHLGRFLRTLKVGALLPRTIIVVTADHGEESLDHGSYWHGGTLFDEVLQVPLIVYAPGEQARSVEQRVSTADVFPTVVDLLGLPPAPNQAGRSLMRGAERSSERAPIVAATAFRGALKLALIEGDEKLIQHGGGEVVGLFDLGSDPRETRDLSSSRPARVREMVSSLTTLARPSAVAAGGATTLDAATAQQLRALGYHDD